MRIIILSKKEEQKYLKDLEEITDASAHVDFNYFQKGANLIYRFFGLEGLYYGKAKSEERAHKALIELIKSEKKGD